MFLKTKTSNKDEKNELNELYLANLSEYIRFSKELMKPLSYDKDSQEYDVKQYNEAINYIVDYLRNNFSDEQLKNGASLEIDINSLLSGTKNIVMYNILEPQFRDLIYIISESSYPHFHTDGKCVIEAEGINYLPGLDGYLRQPKINDMFKGMEIMEARAMLKQMRLLPPLNNLESEINIYENMKSIHRHFILSVVYILLMSKEPSDVVRARLFAASFNVDFDFAPYDKDPKQDDKKLMKEQQSNC